MKKLFLIIFIAFFAAPTYAACNYMNYCATSPYTVQNPAQAIADATGTTALIENLAKDMIKNELKKATGQNFDVDIKVFGLSELLQGKFKSLTITGNNVEIEGFHFTSIKLQTLCDYNYIDIKSSPIAPRENMVLSVAIEASAADLRNTIEYKDYSSRFSRINLSQIGISSFKVYSPTIDIRGGKLYFTINAKPIGNYPPMDIAIGANLRAQNARIVASQVDFINLYTGFDLTKFSSLLGNITSLTFPVRLIGNKTSEIQIQSVNLVGDRAYINGIVFIPKSSI